MMGIRVNDCEFSFWCWYCYCVCLLLFWISRVYVWFVLYNVWLLFVMICFCGWILFIDEMIACLFESLWVSVDWMINWCLCRLFLGIWCGLFLYLRFIKGFAVCFVLLFTCNLLLSYVVLLVLVFVVWCFGCSWLLFCYLGWDLFCCYVYFAVWYDWSCGILNGRLLFLFCCCLTFCF